MLLNEPLLESVVDILREGLTYITVPKNSIKITNEQRVPAYSGEEFINVYGSEAVNEYDPIYQVRKDVYTINVGITRRLSGIPTDISGQTIYTQDDKTLKRAKATMSNRAFDIIKLLSNNWGIPALINQITGDNYLTDNEFCILSPLGS